MKGEIRSKIEIGSCTIHYRKHGYCWAIVVMPNMFKVDNYHHGVHVHPDRKVIPIKDPDMIYNIIYNHILREQRLIEVKLRKELDYDIKTHKKKKWKQIYRGIKGEV